MDQATLPVEEQVAASGFRVLELKSQNFKRLEAIDITPDPTNPVVTISGKNGAGKSSVLDAIMAAVGGLKYVPLKPVRKGAEKGKITLALGDKEVELIVERSFNAKTGGGTFTVSAADGTPKASPQTYLDSFCGALTFDPLMFMRMDDKAQRAELLKVVELGFDPEASKAQEKQLEQDRRDAGRDADALEKTLANTPKPAATAFIDPEPIRARIKERGDWLRAEQDARHAVEQAATAHTAAVEAVGRLTEEIESLKKTLAFKEGELAQWSARVSSREADIETAQRNLASFNVPADLDDPAADLEAALRNNAELSAVETYGKLKTQAAAARKKHADLDFKLGKLREDRRLALNSVKMPVDGLELTDDGLLYKGIPLDQCATSEQLRISTAIAMRLNPKIRVILIRDGSLLDKDSREMLLSMAREHDYQVWLEVVDEAGGVGFTIENGMVAEEQPATAEGA